MSYRAPVQNIKFLLHDVLGYKDIASMDKFMNFPDDLIDAVIDEAAKFADEKLAPLNASGDKQGAKAHDGKIDMPVGFKDVYSEFVANGWNSVPFSPDHGGQGMPWLVSTAISEMWSGANMAFALCPLLTQGSVELLSKYGSKEQKEKYLNKLVSGEWAGTMCLTEPQAGSDVGAVSTRAVKSGDNYLIKGQKIFITYGEHDLTDNIIHMVLARTPDAPAGTKGISLFVVPKILEDGSRNDVRAISIEHKLGIHASPTAVLNFGEHDGAVGYIVGEENNGLKYMFTMMNNARLAVGVEGVALAENSLQKAVSYASERKQFGKVIAEFPDVKRMLLTIAAQTEAMRGLQLFVARSLDFANSHKDEKLRGQHKDIVDLLIPVLKAHATDLGFEMSSMAMQVFGGIGYVEETGIAQNLRDSRIAMIYEGTNGIQAMDLVSRKIGLFDSLKPEVDKLLEAVPSAAAVKSAYADLAKVTAHIKTMKPEDAGFIAVPYLKMFGTVMGAVIMAASEKYSPDNEFGRKKLETAGFYIRYILPEAKVLGSIIFSDGY